MSVCCMCCLLGRGFCDELITGPEESYRLWCVVVCDLETSLTLNLLTTTIVAPPSNASKWQMGFNSAFKGLMRRPWPTGGCRAKSKQTLFQGFTVLLAACLNAIVISKLFALLWTSVFSVTVYVWGKFCDIY